MQILAKLKALYPHKFGTIYKTREDLMIAAKVWSSALRNISDEIINKSIGKCIDVYKWPPEISEFKKLCVSIKGSDKFKYWDENQKDEINQKNSSANHSFERIIDSGAKVCSLLKSIYPDLSWFQIASKFSELKKKTKIYYKELNEIDHNIELSKYRAQDVIDAFEC